MAQSHLTVRGAKQHNLKNIDVSIPRDTFTVITGVSGSGKSSLAFDTIYAEGQRRYVESLSTYARQFLGQMEKPKVDQITGLSPAIAIQQKTVSKNPRSTVATVTEVMDYLRVLYANVGQPHCPECGRKVLGQSAEQISQQLAAMEPGTKIQLLAPVVRNRKGSHVDVLKAARSNGFTRVRVNGVPYRLDEEPALDRKKKHTVEIVVDRLQIPDGKHSSFLSRLNESVETTLRTADGLLVADVGHEELLLSEHNACPHCNHSFPILSAQTFSFNSPLGMCEQCQGLGTEMNVDPDLIVDDPKLTINEGAIRFHGVVGKKVGRRVSALQAVCNQNNFDLDTPWAKIPEEGRNALLYGSRGKTVRFSYQTSKGRTRQGRQSIGGIIPSIERGYRKTNSEETRRWYASFMRELPCSECNGERLRPEARAVTVGGQTLPETTRYSIREAHRWVAELLSQLDPVERHIAEEVVKEIRERLKFMLNVGLHYLTLDRRSGTLSGGEGQRIRLASQIGSGLMGVVYILDEPSIGLHARDNESLIGTLKNLRDMGNTVLVVEHDEETMRAADWIIDLGPSAGAHGGELVAEGPIGIVAASRSLTGKYLSGEECITPPHEVRRGGSARLLLYGARLNNLKGLDVSFPLETLTCITGVSGSGKSSLVTGTLYPILAQHLMGSRMKPGPYSSINGIKYIDKVIQMTQDPIGRTPRSNPVTYTGVFDEIRQLFTLTPDSKRRGYKAGRFSFNVKGGRCEACRGHGLNRIELHFLADVWIPCRECDGQRYNRETLSVTYRGQTIADVLEMEVQEALEFFKNHRKVRRILGTLSDVGLGYLKLGQSATTLSGGEAQRIKLAKELGKQSTSKTLYILDEPTTGLHFADIKGLLNVLHRLVDRGNTVVVIEHNLDVIKTADWIIDLGPEGGEGGGAIVAEGTPETITSVAEYSQTGHFLQQVMARKPEFGALATTKVA
jgi:excinuclease ABC subunit A